MFGKKVPNLESIQLIRTLPRLEHLPLRPIKHKWADPNWKPHPQLNSSPHNWKLNPTYWRQVWQQLSRLPHYFKAQPACRRTKHYFDDFFSVDVTADEYNTQETVFYVNKTQDICSHYFDTHIAGHTLKRHFCLCNPPFGEVFIRKFIPVIRTRKWNLACVAVPMEPTSRMSRQMAQLYRILEKMAKYRFDFKTHPNSFFPETTRYRTGRGTPHFAEFTIFILLNAEE